MLMVAVTLRPPFIYAAATARHTPPATPPCLAIISPVFRTLAIDSLSRGATPLRDDADDSHFISPRHHVVATRRLILIITRYTARYYDAIC